MARKKKVAKRGPKYEHFYFGIESWAFHQSVRVHTDRISRSDFGPASEYRELKLEGPIISRTKRPILRAELLVSPGGPDPADWPENEDSVGTVIQTVAGKMMVLYRATAAALQAMLTVAAAGRLVEFSVTVEDLRYGRGRVVRASVETEPTDPHDLP